MSPPALAATISNLVDYGTIPQPPYAIPDTAGLGFILGKNVFYVVDAVTGDTTSLGASHGADRTARLVLARNVAGSPGLGCTSEADSTSDFANVAELNGRIVLIQRGACPFYVKARSAEQAGAIAFIVYNPPTRVPDTATNMSGGTPGDEFVDIPGVMLPWALAAPLFDEVESGGTVVATLRCDPRPGDCFVDAAEGGPSAAGAGLFFAGENPARTARLVVRAPAPETVTVTAHDMTGREVARLHGERVVTLGAAGLPAGVYFVRAIGETFRHTQQVTLVR